MNRQLKVILTGSTIAALLTSFTLPVLAFRASVGAIAGVNKLQTGAGNGKDDGKDDLTFSPLLLEMARLIGRTGLPEGFFLENNAPFPDAPGLDLRTLLLYQAGLIKMPVHLTNPHKVPSRREAAPKIAVPRIPVLDHGMTTSSDTTSGVGGDNANTVPSLASEPMPREPLGSQPVEPKANVGSPEQISLSEQATKAVNSKPGSSPMLSFDLTSLKSATRDHKSPVLADGSRAATDDSNGDDDVVVSVFAPELHAGLPRLAMLMPRTNMMPFITKNSFKLWTFRPDARDLQLRGIEKIDGSDTAFNGTFVIATTGAIKSITGRHFTMAAGRLLASNQGGELLLGTGLGDVSVGPQSTVMVEVSMQNSERTVRIFALQSGDGASVNVTLPTGKEKTLRLDAGEALVLGDHELTTVDFGGTHFSAKNKLGGHMARATFAVSEFIDKDLMLKSDATLQKRDNEEFATLTELKRHLDQHDQAH